MKEYILIFPLLGIMVVYYYFLSRIDKFISTEEALYETEEFTYKDILLYKDADEIVATLKANNLKFDLVEYPGIPRFCYYKVVVGVSNSDLDNLLLCKTAKRFDPFVRTVAKCNVQMYQEMFHCEEIDAVVADSSEVKVILGEWEVLH